MFVSLIGLSQYVQVVHLCFKINLSLSYCIIKQFQMVKLARKWLDANISCCPANGLSNILFYLLYSS